MHELTIIEGSADGYKRIVRSKARSIRNALFLHPETDLECTHGRMAKNTAFGTV